jgi:hypothetical protein
MEQPERGVGHDAVGGSEGEGGADVVGRQRRVRNVSVAGAEGHGKTTLARTPPPPTPLCPLTQLIRSRAVAVVCGATGAALACASPPGAANVCATDALALFRSSFDVGFGGGEAQECELCLIDTPGHTDLTVEVRALPWRRQQHTCEGRAPSPAASEWHDLLGLSHARTRTHIHAHTHAHTGICWAAYD